MRTVHTEPTPVGWLKPGDRIAYGTSAATGRLCELTVQEVEIKESRVWVRCDCGTILGPFFRDYRVQMVVSDHSEASLFAPEGTLF